MATNFGPSATEVTPIGSNLTPKEGVAKQPLFLQGVNNLFEQASGILEANAEGKQQKIIADFTNKQLGIADAVDQGKYNSRFAQTLIRNNLMAAIDANPRIAKELVAAQASIMGLSGAAKVIDEGTQQEQDRSMLAEAALKDGLIKPGYSDAELDQAIDYNMTAQEAKRRHESRMSTIAEAKAAVDLTKAQREELDAQGRQADLEFIRDSAPAQIRATRGEFETIIKDDSLTESEKVEAIEQYMADLDATIATQVGYLTESEMGTFKKPFTSLADLYKKKATGELSDAEVSRQVDRAISFQQMLLIQDPDIAAVAGASKLVNPEVLSQSVIENRRLSNALMKMFAGGEGGTPVNPFTRDPNQEQATGEYVKTVTENITSTDPDIAADATKHFISILSNIDEFEGSIRKDPRAAKSMVDAMASSSFLKAIQNTPNLEDILPQARDVIQRHYYDEVMGAVSREFTNGKVQLTTGPESDYRGNTSVRPSVNPQALVIAKDTKFGVEFVPIDPSNADSIKEAQKLNKTLKPIINKTVAAMAHLEGGNDYAGVWAATKERFLQGVGFQGDEGDADLEEFVKKKAVQAQGLVSMIDATEGAGNYDTLFGHAQNGNFSGISVSSMSIGELKQFTDPNGAYGQYVRRNNPTGAVATPLGRYQIVGKTLARVAKALNLPDNTIFNSEVQDAMFSYLVTEAIKGRSSTASKVKALKGVWAGFNGVSDSVIAEAIAEFERNMS